MENIFGYKKKIMMTHHYTIMENDNITMTNFVSMSINYLKLKSSKQHHLLLSAVYLLI